MESGYQFERYIFDLYKRLGKKNLQHNLLFRKGKDEAQLDIIYKTWKGYRFCECKFRSKNNVSFEDYNKFIGVLYMLGYSPSRGEMVTNQDYDARTKRAAKRAGVKLYNGQDLARLEYHARPIYQKMCSQKIDLEKIIRKF
jgi:hypothetical protein